MKEEIRVRRASLFLLVESKALDQLSKRRM